MGIVGMIVAVLVNRAVQARTGHSLGVIPVGILSGVLYAVFAAFHRPRR